MKEKTYMQSLNRDLSIHTNVTISICEREAIIIGRKRWVFFLSKNYSFIAYLILLLVNAVTNICYPNFHGKSMDNST